MSITTAREAAGAWDPVSRHRLGDVEIATTRSGRGDPVVCLHAIAHGAGDYRPFAERVADACEVVAVDWPGHGRSGPAVAPASAGTYADVLESLLARVSDRPAILVGCSIGGAAAILVAARRPDLVRALVLCDTGGLLPVDAFTRAATAGMSRFFGAGARGAAWYPRAFGLYYRLVLPGAPAAEQRARIVSAARETASPLAEAWASFGEPEADLRPLVTSIAQPTLFAWAKSDRILPWSRNRAAASTFPNHRVEFFEGGHAAFLEDPDRFAATFRRFLSELGPAARPPVYGSGPAA